MRAVRNFVFLLILLGALGAGGWFGYNQLFKSYSIERTYRAGETWEYVGDIDVTTPGGGGVITLVYRIKTEKVEPDGNAVLSYTIREFKAPGMSPAQISAMKQQLNSNGLKVRADANARESVLEGQPLQLSLGSATAALYPTKSVRIGEEWEHSENQNGIAVIYASKIAGIEKYNGRDCYKITTKMKSPEGAQVTVSGFMNSYIDLKMGWALALEGPMTVGAQGASNTLTTKIKGKRIASQQKS